MKVIWYLKKIKKGVWAGLNKFLGLKAWFDQARRLGSDQARSELILASLESVQFKLVALNLNDL